MTLAIWKERVLSEYEKLKAFARIERAELVKTEWQKNIAKLEADHKEFQENRIFPKWYSPEKKGELCYINKCAPIPNYNVWTPINKSEKCPIEEENVLHNLPRDDTKDGDQGFALNLLNAFNVESATSQPDILMEDNMLVELVGRLKQKYDAVNQKNNFYKCKTQIFKAISYHFYDNMPTKSLMSKYEKLVAHGKDSALNETMEDCSGESSAKGNFTKPNFCIRCFKYCCIEHSNSVSIGANLNKEPHTGCGEITQKPKTPCGKDCFLRLKTSHEANVEHLEPCTSSQAKKRRRLHIKTESVKWSSNDFELFRALHNIFKDNCCIIARTMRTKSCAQVYELSIKEETEVLKPTSKLSNKIKEISRSTMNRNLPSAQMKTNNYKNCRPYTPCNHPEKQACGKGCVCRKTKNFCEPFCKCSKSCPNRFIGCKCKSNCGTSKCPCYSYDRECDPVLCNSCGAAEIATFENRCKNINLQRGLRKHILVAPSDVAGWGAFLKDGAKQNEYITEYCGEIITQKEADRRGKIYDKIKCSYLFELDEESVIDATRMGSKIRFANHSNNPNCYAKVLRVSGDNRIGIFAKRDIEPEEELFFDYKYSKTEYRRFLNN